MKEKFTPSAPLRTAVLFLVFNRPDTTAQVLEAIRKAKPPRLYVAADGPRANREGEAARVARVREIATAVDWPCEVKTLFREENLGCKYGLQTGITWFFKHEEQGIILEDDCLPHPDFFRYCEWALEEFKNVPEVWHINGNNFGADAKLFNGDSIGFSSLPQVWGWASWSNRWRYYQGNPFYLSEVASARAPDWLLSLHARTIKLAHIRKLKKGLDTWDYQWQVAVLNANGLAVCPSSNLISNLGDGPDATHTENDRKRVRLPVSSLEKFDYSAIRNSVPLTNWYEGNMGLRSTRTFLRIFIYQVQSCMKAKIRSLVVRLLFLGQKKIVIASTGRSGSTMLTNEVARSLIMSRFSKLPKGLQSLLLRLSRDYVDRLCKIRQKKAPILKTHDTYDEKYRSDAKYIFVYGDPLESAMSVSLMGEKYGTHWVEEHIFHLRGNGSTFDIFESDVLNYEQQIASWDSAPDALLLHYEDLWDRVDEISKFIGFRVALPRRFSRRDKQQPDSHNIEMFQRLRRLSEDLRLQRLSGG